MKPARKHDLASSTVASYRQILNYHWRPTSGLLPLLAVHHSTLVKRDRPSINPFSIADAEMLYAALPDGGSEAQANHDEFRFFSRL